MRRKAEVGSGIAEFRRTSGDATDIMRSERGFTLLELLLVIAIIGVIAAIAAVQMLRARAASNESSAIASMRAIASGQLSYASSCGLGGFATALPTLGVPVPGSNAPFLSPDLTSAAVVGKSGYLTTMAAGAGAVAGNPDCNGTVTQTAYYASSSPMTLGITGSRSFAINGAGTIWTVNAAVPPTEPFGAPAQPLQ